MMDLATRQRIAEALLSRALDADGYAPCPGRDKHGHRDGKRDFKVWLNGAPSGRCVHESCAAEVETFNHALRSRIAAAESDRCDVPPSSPLGSVAARPVPPREAKRPPYDPAALVRVASLCGRAVSAEWLASRSPVPVPAPEVQGVTTAETFLSALYGDAEKALVFTSQLSQGDFLWQTGKGAFRLARERDVEPVASPLPTGAPEGVWFLTNPVCGDWRINPQTHGKDGSPRWSRRHGDCVTSWRFLLLESDSAPEGLWLRALLVLPLPIAAIYTSGGRSLHALVRLDASGKLEWDAARDDLLPLMCRLGADGAAMSAVRLSRLPGCFRHGKRDKAGNLQRYDQPALQRLIYLNPNPPTDTAILDFIK